MMDHREHDFYDPSEAEKAAQSKRNYAIAGGLVAFIGFTGLVFFFKMTDENAKAPAKPAPANIEVQ